MMANNKSRPVTERIAGLVEIITESGCWIWMGCTNGRGYGQVKVDTGKPPRRAHIASYLAFNGEIPAGMVVRHKCDISLCVAPHHLELGTQKQNMQDASKRGRLNPKSLLNLKRKTNSSIEGIQE